MMRTSDILRLSFQSILRLRMKSALSVLSIAIGVAAVYLILSLSASGELLVEAEINRLGIGGLSLYAAGNNGESNRLPLSVADTLESSFPFIEKTMPLTTTIGLCKLKGEQLNAVILGADDALPEVMGITLRHGRLLTPQDVQHERRKAIIDNTLAQRIYKRDNIVGKTIELTVGNCTESFEIIGVIEAQTSLLYGISGGRLPSFIYIPYTVSNAMSKHDTADQIAIRCSEDTDLTVAAAAIESGLNRRETDITYSVENINGYVDQVQNLVGMLSLLLTFVAGISLFVAGIGVMNRMLSSVAERKKEIGIWIAIGAEKADIFKLLLAESVILCLFGGILGSVLGLGSAAILKYAAGLKPGLDWIRITVPLLFTMTIGVLFGVLPSGKASKLNPVVLLREE